MKDFTKELNFIMNTLREFVVKLIFSHEELKSKNHISKNIDLFKMKFTINNIVTNKFYF